MEFEPLSIVGVVTEDVSSPRNDGSAGSALYAVPVQLSRRLSTDEARILEALWDRPPSFTTMHRPGIAYASGDRIVLDGTTVDEVASYHARTLKLIVEKFNLDVPSLLAEGKRRAQESARREQVHRDHVASVAAELRFE